MSPLYGVMGVFIQHPWLAAVIGVVLLFQGTDVKRATPIVAGVLWLLYAGYETGIKLRWFCTGECNIRVDLLLFYPVLLVLLISAIVSLYRARRKGPGRSR
jgi:hypothetical protein